MKKAIILHGTMGSPEGNWFRWLELELKSKGLVVWLPVLPHSEQPSLKEWSEFIQKNCPFDIDQETLIVGHSSGAILALIVAQQLQKKVGALVCVSVFCDNSLGWEPNDKLFDVDFDFENIKNHAQKLIFVHSDNDPYTPVAKAEYVAKNSGQELIILKGQGHFNLEQSPDYEQFPQLITILQDNKVL